MRTTFLLASAAAIAATSVFATPIAVSDLHTLRRDSPNPSYARDATDAPVYVRDYIHSRRDIV